MRVRTLTIVGIAAVAVLVLAAALAIVLYRTQRTAASSYEVQSAKWWSAAAGGFSTWADQILSLKPDQTSQQLVCHYTKVQMERLNSISLAGEVPDEYTRFHATLLQAIDTNAKYYRKILQLCSEGAEADGTLIASLFALGKDTENKYQTAYNLNPSIGPGIQNGISVDTSERIARIYAPKPKKAEQPKVVEVPRSGYSPSFPPAVGSIVYVDTPRKGPLNLREAPSAHANRVEGRETVGYGERVLVLDRAGDWLLVETTDGYIGYIRWWYDGTSYVKP